MLINSNFVLWIKYKLNYLNNSEILLFHLLVNVAAFISEFAEKKQNRLAFLF